MKAPEKLYIALSELTEDGRTFVLDHRVDYPTCTEYTRTDAFIEKACSWLKENADMYEAFDLESKSYYMDKDKLVEEFKNYMKGE